MQDRYRVEMIDEKVARECCDGYPNKMRTRWRITDLQTDKICYRVGDTRFIGNYSPTWIKWRGETLQITEFLRRYNGHTQRI